MVTCIYESCNHPRTENANTRGDAGEPLKGGMSDYRAWKAPRAPAKPKAPPAAPVPTPPPPSFMPTPTAPQPVSDPMLEQAMMAQRELRKLRHMNEAGPPTRKLAEPHPILHPLRMQTESEILADLEAEGLSGEELSREAANAKAEYETELRDLLDEAMSAVAALRGELAPDVPPPAALAIAAARTVGSGDGNGQGTASQPPEARLGDENFPKRAPGPLGACIPGESFCKLSSPKAAFGC